MAIVAARDDPSTESSDHKAMSADWQMVRDIMAGARAIRDAGARYLPQFQKESAAAYKFRLNGASWRPLFADALRNLCSKPFTKEVVVNVDAPDALQGEVVNDETKKRGGGFVDDVDGQGNSLHVFARETFENGVAFGLEAIYVAYPETGPARTKAEERAVGARPYWVHVRAENILALTTRVVSGHTVVSHARMRECTMEQDGFSETEVERVRVLDLPENGAPVWRLFRKGTDDRYALESEGSLLGVDSIPIALFFTGQRSGNYRVKPPLIDLAHMQIEIYCALARQDEILTYAGSPMLVGRGMAPPQPEPIFANGVQAGERPAAQIEVGPKVVLFAPPSVDGVQPDWGFIQPDAANIQEIRKDVESRIDDFRRLAMQPATPRSGNMLATGQAIDAAKAHSAVEVWANGLADALNQALMFTCQWMRIADTVTAVVHTDFGVDIAGEAEMTVLGGMQKRGVVSAQTEREEAARRGILGPQFDEAEEIARIASEQQGLEPETEMDPRTGLLIGESAPQLAA